MASPADSFQALFSEFGRWLPDVGATLSALLIAFIISAVGGVLIGFAIGLSRFWSDVLLPLVTAAYSIPKVVLYPIFLLVFGLTTQGRIAFSVMHGILPMIIICAEATATVPAIQRKVARSYDLSFSEQVRYVLLPSILPSVVAGLRMVFGFCFVGLIVAEIFAAYEGMGFRMARYMELTQTERLFAAVLVIAFIGFFGTYIFLLLQERQERRVGKLRVSL